ncbi:hypothetical protein BD779DRAFT_1676999 [Infundibulicybe gibba]|nr:hypothetical protein BD779DRAFT_1676999 [Infundibulicybe gibba]
MSICLSAAPILRCESFTKVQTIVMIIPTALEVIFSTSLIFMNWGNGRRNLILTFEGWVYFALAIIELLSHIVPAAQDDLSVFKIFDIFLASASSLPIFLYTFFIYLLARSELLDTLPGRFQTISRLMLAIFIPAIVILNEIASFIGIKRISTRFSATAKPVVAIGFNNDRDEILWQFFTSLTLALLTAYQAITFVFAFYRLLRAFINQRRIETSSSDQTHLFKGIGWINGGIKLGALETIAGFAQGSFGVALTRRILRFLARAFLCIGLVKGVDSTEDFRQVQDELASSNRGTARRSRLYNFISNPRFSTFRQLSPTATAFHSETRTRRGLTNSMSQVPAGLPGMQDFASLRLARARQRVTVNFEGGAPTLHMRFSTVDLSDPLGPKGDDSEFRFNNNVEWRAFSQPAFVSSPLVRPTEKPAQIHSKHPYSARSSYDAGSPQSHHTPTTYSRPAPVPMPSRQSAAADSIYAVRELTPQFPPLPEHVIGRIDQPLYRNVGLPPPMAPGFASNRGSSIPPSRSRTPYSIDPFDDEEEGQEEQARIAVTAVGAIVDPRQPAPVEYEYEYEYDGAETSSNTSVAFAHDPSAVPTSTYTSTTAGTEDPFPYDRASAALNTGGSRELMRSSGNLPASNSKTGDNLTGRPMSDLPSLDMIEGRRARVSRAPSQLLAVEETESPSEEPAKEPVSPCRNQKMQEVQQKLVRTLTEKAQPNRIKNVGKAPRRTTPSPVKTKHTRGSIYLEPIVIPINGAAAMTEAVQGSVTSASSRATVSRASWKERGSMHWGTPNR